MKIDRFRGLQGSGSEPVGSRVPESVLRRVLLFGVGALFLAPAALATDGVLEISQACVSTGCFTGDEPGWPVKITATGSYRLTSNLIVPDTETTGISVHAVDVGIDLNNFAIIRSGCEGAPSDGACAPVESVGRGISCGEDGCAVKNGSVTGMGGHGIYVSNQGEVRNVRARWNGRFGILAGEGSTIAGNLSYGNLGNGIYADNGTTFTGNTVFRNGSSGISAYEGAMVRGNTAYLNGGTGIFASEGSTVSRNTSFANSGKGIWAGSGSTAVNNTVYGNNDTGIFAHRGTLVQGNVSKSNQGYGLFAWDGTVYLDNVFAGNSLGAVGSDLSEEPVNRGGNYCDGTGVSSAECP